MSYEEVKAKMYGEQWWKEKRFMKKQIPEIPFMIAEDGRIVCLPQEKDQPTLEIAASKRTGKSTVLNSFFGRTYWYWNSKNAHMNDSLNETLNWDKPNLDFNVGMFRITKEKGIGLPKINVYPHTNTLRENTLPKEDMLVMSFPIQTIAKNFGNYFDLGKSRVYYNNIIENISNVKTEEELYEVIDESLQSENKKTDGFENTKFKIKSAFTDILNEKLADISTAGKKSETYGEVVLKLVVKNKSERYENFVFSALMHAGANPILNSGDLFTKRYCYNYYALLLKQMFENQLDDPEFKHERINLFFDEILTLISTENKNPASIEITDLIKRGGPNRIGIFYTTLNHSKIPGNVRSNTKYLIALAHSSDKEAKEIAKDFSLSKVYTEAMLKFKKFQCLACTKERFVTYDEYGNREFTDEPIIGTILPPLNYHQPPSGGDKLNSGGNK